MADLGIAHEPGRPLWEGPFRLWMTVARFEGHPFFGDAESRRLRVALGFGEVPEDWSGFDFSAASSARAPR